MVSWTTIVSSLFICYVLNSVWTVYKLYLLPPCVEGSQCIPSYLEKQSDFQCLIYQSTSAKSRKINSMNLIDNWDDFDYSKSYEKTVQVKMLETALTNGTVYVHVFLIPKILRQKSMSSVVSSPFVVVAQGTLTKYAIPEDKTFNLLAGEAEKPRRSEGERMRNHWKSHLLVELVKDKEQLPVSGLPKEIIKFIKLTPEGEYLPPMYIDTLSNRIKDLQLINAGSEEMNLTIYYNPISFGKLRLWTQLEAAMTTMKSLGFTEKDVDEVKGIFTDTNFYLLCTTFMIAAVHLMFDILAFKNDIVFWSKKKTMVGLSVRTVIWRCVSHTIIFLYLLDERTSLIVLIPTGIGAVIEMWKVCKAFKVQVKWKKNLPTFSFGSCTEDEKKTEVYDAQIMNYLLYVLYPTCMGGAIYSLIYMPHKSWYSWSVQSLVNGIYAFGFLFMLPQLFVNYKLKSVAHLPWKAFMYKAFNTFIDDIFAFIITMPTAHRVACFRDDIVFVIYLYQRWLYPVDKTRLNEFGDSFNDDDVKQKKN